MSKVRICPNCGHEENEFTYFCSLCGWKTEIKEQQINDNPVGKVESSSNSFISGDNKTEVKNALIHSESKNNDGSNGADSFLKSSFKIGQKNFSKTLVIVLVAVVVLFIGGSIVAIFMHTNKANEENTTEEVIASNVSTGTKQIEKLIDFANVSNSKYYDAWNWSYVAGNNNYIFYTKDGSVIRMNAYGDERIRILDEYECADIFLVSDSLFFLSTKDGTIYKSDLDGNNIISIINDNVGWFYLDGRYIFYCNGYYEFNQETWESVSHGDFYLCRVDLDGGSHQVITEDPTSDVIFTESAIYYLNTYDSSVYTIDFEGNNKQLVYSGNKEEFYHGFVVYEDNLYYAKTDYANDSVSGIYAFNIKTGDTNKIVSTIPESFVFWKDKMIFVADANSSIAKTYISSLTGEGRQELLSDKISNPIVLGDFLFYTDYDFDEGADIVSYVDLKSNKKGAFEEKTFDNLICADNTLFYIDKRDNNIYRSNLDGSNIIRLTNAECDSLYYYDGFLYYEGYANGYTSETARFGIPGTTYPHGFIRLDVNGREATCLDGDVRYGALLDGEYVYYPSSFDSNLYKIGLDSVRSSEDTPPFVWAASDESYETVYLATDGWIYVSLYNFSDSSNSIVRIGYDGNGKQTIIDGWASQLQLYENIIYYLNGDNTLRRVNPDGTKDEYVNSESIYKYEIVNDVVYYIDSDDHKLCRINLDGTQRKVLVDAAVSDFAVQDGSIYYVNKYDHGTIYLLDSDGSLKQLIGIDYDYTISDSYQTHGIDDYKAEDKSVPKIAFASSDILSFDDPEFERFLCVMFNKELGTITGGDLLSVRFLGYYEGEPSEKSTLINYGFYSYLFENCVLFNTGELTSSIDVGNIMFDEASGDTLDYRNSCIEVGVISNEWMAEHVMPYLYYFKNLEYVVWGYCWVSSDACLPYETEELRFNTHSRYLHAPY